MTTLKILACSTLFLLVAILTIIYFKDDDVEEVTHSELANIQNHANSFPTYLWYMGSSERYDFFHASHNKNTDLGYSGIYKVQSKSLEISARFTFTEDISKWIQYHPPFN